MKRFTCFRVYRRDSASFAGIAASVLFALVTLSACGQSYVSFNEPEVRGRVFDEATQQPIKGALVYGYFALVEGSLAGGERMKSVPHSFAVATDEQGVFSIPRWETERHLIDGVPRNQFPVLAIYKGGYQAYIKGLRSLRDWEPVNRVSTANPAPSGNLYDWTTRPHLLTPASTERERYDALRTSERGMRYDDLCGWEQFAGVLMEQHREWKGWYLRNIPANEMDVNGYPKGTYFGPPEISRLNLIYSTNVDDLFKAFGTSQSSWKCSDPRNVFVEKK